MFGEAGQVMDLAMLILEREATLNKMVQIAKLPKEDDPCPKDYLISSGWGGTWKEDDPNPIDIAYRPITLTVVRQMCLDATVKCPKFSEEANVLCVGDPITPSNSPCNEDDGGTKDIIEQFQFYFCKLYIYIYIYIYIFIYLFT